MAKSKKEKKQTNKQKKKLITWRLEPFDSGKFWLYSTVLPAQNVSHCHLTTPHWILRSQNSFMVRICSFQGKTTKQNKKKPQQNLEINCFFSYQQQPIDTGTLTASFELDDAFKIRHTPR